MNTNAAKKLTISRSKLLLDNYFFGRLALYLQMVEKPEIPTLAVDGAHIYYNPQFILSLSEELVTSAIAHEIMHCVFEHIFRRGSRDPFLWNCAGDYAINLVLADSGFRLGPGWLLNVKYRDWFTEQIYEDLQQKGSAGSPLCDILPAAGNKEELEEKQYEWGTVVVQAANETAQRGSVPAGLARLFSDMASPKIPWREVLQYFLVQIARDDFSWRRPNRRYVASGLYLPMMYSEDAGPIAVAIDTSGSISAEMLEMFAAEIRSIVAQVRPERVTVIYTDAAVNHVDVFNRGEELQFDMHGGGGTDFRPAIQRAGEDQPLAMVYLTDLEGPTGDDPGFPVLWCCTRKHTAPWGQTIYLDA